MGTSKQAVDWRASAMCCVLCLGGREVVEVVGGSSSTLVRQVGYGGWVSVRLWFTVQC